MLIWLIMSSVYQEFLAKSLTDKYSTLSNQMDKIIHDANSEIMGLRDKLSGTAPLEFSSLWYLLTSHSYARGTEDARAEEP